MATIVGKLIYVMRALSEYCKYIYVVKLSLWYASNLCRLG